MKKEKRTIMLLLTVLFLNSNQLFAQSWNQIVASYNRYPSAGDQYGGAVSVSGNFAIIGARKDNTLGSATILKFNSSTNAWEFFQEISAIVAEKGDEFGCSVSISGNYAIVGAYREGQNLANGEPSYSQFGAAYIYKYDAPSDRWDTKQKLDLGDNREHYDDFGYSVSINNGYAIVGAIGEDEDEANINTKEDAGSAFIYKYNSTSDTWYLQQKIVASDRDYSNFFGQSVNINGNYAIVGAPDAGTGGKAYLFYRNPYARPGTNEWSEVEMLTSSDISTDDKFGCSVSYSNGVVIVGARFEDEDQDGVNTLGSAGSAYFFKNISGTWTQVQKIRPKIRAIGDYFGTSVSISGDYAVIGAMMDDEDASESNSINNAGSAYIFKYNSSKNIWEQSQKLAADDRGSGDYFGASVAIANDTVIVGANYNDIEGDPNIADAGSAYIFHYIDGANPVELTNFTATITSSETVLLNWQTATEVNNYGFEIECASAILGSNTEFSRSAEGWKTIGFVEGHGNSNSPKEYSFVDTDILSGTVQYRLKQIDIDGAFEYSDVVTVELGVSEEYKLVQNYPNPFNPTTQIAFTIPSEGIVKLNVYNVLGEVVTELVNQNLEAGLHQYQFNASNLTSGIYFYSISVNGFREVRKMNLVK